MIVGDEGAYFRAHYYRWWTVSGWHDGDLATGTAGVKLGPVTVSWYRWDDGRLRVGVCVLGHDERIVWGGPRA